MMIAYLTHDEVNAEFAILLAERFDSDLTVLTLKDMDQFVATDMLLIDLDHLPPECRSHLFVLAQRGKLRKGLAVHSYAITRAEVRSLRRARITVARRLSPELMASLCLAAIPGINGENVSGESQSPAL